MVCRGRIDFIHRFGCSLTEQTSQTVVPGERRGANERRTGVSFPIGTARMINFFRAASERGTLLTPRKKFIILAVPIDRKSTRLNSSHQIISYAVFCLKKKN